MNEKIPVYKMVPNGNRERGGFPLQPTVEFLRRSLIGESDHRKAYALQEIGRILDITLNLALSGDKLSGHFLADLTTSLNKRRSRIDEANKAFRLCYAAFESARRATKRSSGLRAKIEQIMFAAESKRCMREISKRLMKGTCLKFGSAKGSIGKLPPPDHTSQPAITRWSDFVYAELRKIRLELKAQPGIGDRKGNQIDGKFQVSRLRDKIPSDVQRIFKVWERENLALRTLAAL
ncbi:MAG: hypothetical protein WA183_15970 [Chthoniobacterales bacterium]